MNEVPIVHLRPIARWVLTIGAVAVGLALAWALSNVLPLTLIDFQHYYQASHMIWQNQNPYGVVEFFAPPWIALFIAPLLLFPIKLASAAWVIMSLSSVASVAIVSEHWFGAPTRSWARLACLALMILTPAALFVYITGQLTAIVVLAALVVGSETMRPAPRSWLLAVALAVTALKPNIIWLPVALAGLQVVRQCDWRTVAVCAGLVGALATVSFIWLPDWPASLLAVWLAGAYRGGVGLVAAGYIGLPDLGVPTWIFAPVLAYVFWCWWKNGLSPRVLALAFAVCLLVTPYSRAYDDLVLILPSVACLAAPGGARRQCSVTLMIFAWIVPLLTLAVLAPVLTTIALLIALPSGRPDPIERLVKQAAA